MKRIFLLIILMIFIRRAYSQTDTVTISNTYDTCQIIYIYTPSQGIYGIRVNGFAILYDYYSMARVILVTKDSLEVLIYEAYPWLYNSDTITITNKADESLYLEALDSTYIKVEIVNSDLYIENILFDTSYVANINILRTTHHDSIVDLKVDSINNNIQTDSLIWEADSNCLANLKYYQKKIFYNISDTDLLNTFGIEYYKNGVFSNIGQSIPAVTQSNLIDNFDWRNRHSENWVSPVKNQGTTSWCTSFATNGALESVINLYYNNITNIILSEKAYYSCLNDIYNLQSCFQYNDIWRWLCYQQNIGAMNIACCPFTNSTSGLCDEILCSPYNNFLWKSASFERITPNINPDLDDIKENLIS